jgi:hypothetical protein
MGDKMSDKKYSDKEIKEAIMFALNYPREVEVVRYDVIQDKYLCRVWEYGYPDNIRLDGFFIRSCLEWQGKKEWKKKEPVDYEKLFGPDYKVDN